MKALLLLGRKVDAMGLKFSVTLGRFAGGPCVRKFLVQQGQARQNCPKCKM